MRAWRLLAAKTYAGMGRKEDAIREGKLATAMMPESKSAWFGAGVLESFAEIYVMLGDADHAISILTHLLAVPSDVNKEQLRVDPIWDPLRNDSRFRELLKQPNRTFPLDKASTPLVRPMNMLPRSGCFQTAAGGALESAAP